MQTFQQHLKAMSDLQTIGQFADYLHRYPETDGMRTALLECVPATIRAEVTDALDEREPYRRGIDA